MSHSEELFRRAVGLMPGGVNSPVRAFKSVGGTPRFIVSARGCRLTDVDGRQYIDYIGSWGPMILGHAHPEVTEALAQCLANGTSYGAPCPAEVELAEEICRRMPSIERIRFVNSGTEAVMSAIRLARAATGRTHIVKFEGCYHGHADSLLVKAGSGVATFALPDSPGVTSACAETTLIAPFNDLAAVEELFETFPEKIAAVIVEPIAGNMGVVPPASGFLDGLGKITSSDGALLIFDEVMTGFRVAAGGAQSIYEVRPDLTTMGKIIGGGLPVGAYGGRADLMDMIAPAGPVYQAGTLSGNPLAMTAGLTTLRQLDQAAYATLDARSAELQQGLESLLQEHSVPGVVQRAGSMLTLFFSDQPVRNFHDAKSCEHRRFAAFFHEMLERGVHLPPSGYEAWFVSLAHDSAAIAETLSAAREGLRKIAAG
ncbi:MAG: glutamate-1-semialdehyde 2,1-aminomutase [Planctomycetia bacterium]|nr:glutamate-1-semialdehyde 2,1-aminomutase [Planctomycetia bacterium]MCC7314291.1 glutamate-1-semialdehyde 2,1-aminomutase [Planctomycetota bacterium]OQZ05591.1 MAG: glutamate-1-semialdehyde-2,1-aminomutase [Planctomycetes bacterium UTPLA1]